MRNKDSGAMLAACLCWLVSPMIVLGMGIVLKEYLYKGVIVWIFTGVWSVIAIAIFVATCYIDDEEMLLRMLFSSSFSSLFSSLFFCIFLEIC